MVIVFTDLARQDLVSIEEYTRKKWGVQQAEIYLRQIEDRILGLLETLFLGAERPDIVEGYRCLPEGKHLIFYRVDNDIVYVIGIPHTSMDLEKHLEPKSIHRESSVPDPLLNHEFSLAQRLASTQTGDLFKNHLAIDR